MFNLPIKGLLGKNKVNNDLGLEAEKDLANLLELCEKNLKKYDAELITKAFQWCFEAHEKNIRKSGLPYYTHPVSVAKIIVEEMPLDDISVASALLHDVMDYSDKYTLKDIRSEFGSTLTQIVDGISKIRHIEGHGLDNVDQRENYQRLLLSMFKDVRIILIKLADRLHNMRTVEHLPAERQKNLSKETLEIYSPFAHRFGLGNIKWELEDLSFKVLNKPAYEEIVKSIHGTRRERESYIKKFVGPIRDRLQKDSFIKKNGIRFELSGRPKHIYSTYNKLLDRGLPIDELNDLFAIRIILDTDDKNLCFFVYGVVCEVYKPVPGTFKNYIYNPKKNGYQSIHTAVVGPENKHVEVQVRTLPMHQIAERGVAAHFTYKKGPLTAESVLEDKNIQNWMDSVREIFENAEEETPQQLFESIRRNLFQDEIYVFTPANELKLMPKDSTALDFAFNIHSEIGYSCIGAKVNGKVVPLNYKLQSGDQVQILTSDKEKPKREWLNFVVTSRAKSLIHKHLKEEYRMILSKGTKMWQDKCIKNDLVLSHGDFKKLYYSLGFKDEESFFHNIGSGNFDLESNFEFIYYKVQDGLDEKPDRTELLAGINGNGSKRKPQKQRQLVERGMQLNLAECCNPLPGDEIIGILQPGENLMVHRSNCRIFNGHNRPQGTKIIDIQWDDIKKESFTTDILIVAEDRPSMLNDITLAVISIEGTIIKGVSFETMESKFEGKISVEVGSRKQIEEVFKKVYAIDGVNSIDRILHEIA